MNTTISNLINRIVPEGISTNMIGTPNSINTHVNTIKINCLFNNFFEPLEAFGGTPQITYTSDLIIITVPYYIINTYSQLNSNTINSLRNILSKILNREVELRFIKLNYLY